MRKKTLGNLLISMVLIAVVLGLTASAYSQVGCRSGKFPGSYVYSTTIDIFGDGTVIHQYYENLQLHSDGTARMDFNLWPDYMINTGLDTPSIGSWTCRADGKLILTLLTTEYAQTTFHVSSPDLSQTNHFRRTALITIIDDNTLAVSNTRTRTYLPSEDPTNPNGGTLGQLRSHTDYIYHRMIASDADLLVP
jgi:hypothetical protein